MTDRSLELDDIQGNIIGGFNTDYQVFIAFTAASEAGLADAAIWSAGLANEVTTVADVRRDRDRMKQAPPETKLVWLCVAVGHRLLKNTQTDLYIRDEGFNLGMIARAPSVLGDRTDADSWVVGCRERPVDVLLIVASNREADAVGKAAELIASAQLAGLTPSYREICRRLPNEAEHFGFRDGLSQPQVLGTDPGGALPPGNFVFGYPAVRNGPPVVPFIDERKIADNGSLLVFRRLVQDVKAFREFCDAEAIRLGDAWPQFSGAHLQALLVGRWPAGALASVDHGSDPGSIAAGNDFDFSHDPKGLKCPAGAHIRKVNPRMGDKDRVEVPRLLRRGIPFGHAYDAVPDEPRGLNFVAFQTSIRDQFEFLSQHWMNSRNKPAPGQDLLVGRDPGPRSLKVLGPNGEVTIMANMRQWIEPTGGAYLFAPGRSGLRKLGTTPAPAMRLWKLRALAAQAFDDVRALFFKP
jgi:Dyp-type peroxidase family